MTQLPKHQLIGLPAVEIYQTARLNARLQLNVTDICLPVVGSGSGSRDHGDVHTREYAQMTPKVRNRSEPQAS